MIVRPLIGEPLVYLVESRSRGSVMHRVDLSEYGGNGWCGCERFAFACAPHLERGSIPREKYECAHIRAAKRRFTFEMIWAVAEAQRIVMKRHPDGADWAVKETARNSQIKVAKRGVGGYVERRRIKE